MQITTLKSTEQFSNPPFYQLATCEVHGRLALRLLCIFRICIYVSLCICTYHVRNNYMTYVVAMRLYLSQLWQFRRLLCVATVSIQSSLVQLQVREGN